MSNESPQELCTSAVILHVHPVLKLFSIYDYHYLIVLLSVYCFRRVMVVEGSTLHQMVAGLIPDRVIPKEMAINLLMASLLWIRYEFQSKNKGKELIKSSRI